jgi:hypothetical protein
MYHLVAKLEDQQLNQDDIKFVEDLILNSIQEFTTPMDTNVHGYILACLDERGENPLIVDGNFISWNYPLDATNFERYQSYIESREWSFARMEKYAILRLRCPTIHDYYAYMLVKKWGDKFYPLVTIDPLKYHDGQYTIKFDHSIHDTSRHTTRELFDVFFNFIRIKLNPPQ